MILDEEMAEMAAEEWNDSQPVSDVRRVYAKDGKAEHVIVVGEDDAVGTHALVPWDDWEQALELQDAYDQLNDDANESHEDLRARLYGLQNENDELSADYQAALMQIRYLEKDLDEAASDEEDWRVHDLESDIRELQDELESVTSGARCATDLWLESWDREQAEQEWRPVSELPTWEYDGRLNATHEVPENY